MVSRNKKLRKLAAGASGAAMILSKALWETQKNKKKSREIERFILIIFGNDM